MAKGKTITTKGVRYTTASGKKKVLNKEEFKAMIEHKIKRAKIEKEMKSIEEIEREAF